MVLVVLIGLVEHLLRIFARNRERAPEAAVHLLAGPAVVRADLVEFAEHVNALPEWPHGRWLVVKNGPGCLRVETHCEDVGRAARHVLAGELILLAESA